MASWDDLGSDSYTAAEKVFRAGHWRSSASRAYYAVYACITAELFGLATFTRGWNNPRHEALAAHIDRNLLALPTLERRQLKTLVRLLYDARTDADYFPQRSVERDVAQRCLRDAHLVLSALRGRSWRR